MTSTSIFWFRGDLRVRDNPALIEACKHDATIPVYILDTANAGNLSLGAASRVWLHHSLQRLNESLQGKLSFFAGDPIEILPALCRRHNTENIYWNRCYEPWQKNTDQKIISLLPKASIHNASLLWEPEEIQKPDGTYYKVFTPYYKNGCLQAAAPRFPLPAPASPNYQRDKKSFSLEQLQLLPSPRWDKALMQHWQVGETAAQAQLQKFITDGLAHYREGRDFPAKPYTSRISPHLHFGEISPNQLWHATIDKKHGAPFCRELVWREFSYSQLHQHPTLPTENLRKEFNDFDWRDDPAALQAWQQGRTGIPIVDAGMRELYQTGYMHNRIRMVVGSFLVKNLRLHWRHGERWFWDCLLDADLANNSASWQWVAGCGADAAPYFRIFNPILQGQKFDAEGEYTRRFVPELSKLPKKYLFNPWEAPESILQEAGVTLDINYPSPMIDLRSSRNLALKAFQDLKDLKT